MVNTESPACNRCHGRNWIDLGTIAPAELEMIEGELVETMPEQHLYECGGGHAHAKPEEMKSGCMRVIRATPDEMKKGGVI